MPCYNERYKKPALLYYDKIRLCNDNKIIAFNVDSF